MAQGGWVYIMTNKPRGTLYIGATSDIARRAFEYREGAIEGFYETAWFETSRLS